MKRFLIAILLLLVFPSMGLAADGAYTHGHYAPSYTTSGAFTIASIGTTKYAISTSSVLDDGTIVLPTITANSAMSGEVIVSSSGTIDANEKFIADSTGNVTLQYGSSGNVVANADTDSNLCIGTSVANPLTVKNRLGGTKTVMIILQYN